MEMETMVSQMTVSDLRQLIADVLDEKLSEIVDPDKGLELKDELRELLLDQNERIKNGERGTPLEEVLAELGIDESLVKSGTDEIPITVS